MMEQSKCIYTRHCHSFLNASVSESDVPSRQQTGHAKANCSSLLQPPDSQGPRLRKRRSTEAGIGAGSDANRSTERRPRRSKHNQGSIEVDSSSGSNPNDALLAEYKRSRNRYEDEAKKKGRRIQQPLQPLVKCCDCEDVISDRKMCYCDHVLCPACFGYDGQIGEPQEGEIPLGDIAEGIYDDVWELVRKVVKPTLARSGKSSRIGHLNQERSS